MPATVAAAPQATAPGGTVTIAQVPQAVVATIELSARNGVSNARLRMHPEELAGSRCT